MSEIKLKPCPFCGGKGVFPKWMENTDYFWICCEICGCETACYDTKKEAEEAWNKRGDEQNE